MASIYSPQLFSKLSSEWYLATALYDAIDDGNLREVSILLREKHADPNVIIPDYDITPFHLAVGHENELFAKEVTKLLLKNGADPNVKDNEGVTPLHVAAVWNRPTIVRILLTYGGDPSITDDTEKNAFHYAYEEHAWETLKTLEIHRRAEIKKTEITDKSYNIQLDKVIVQGEGVQAEYRPLCEGCKKDVVVEKQSVATQTSPPSVNFKDSKELDSDTLDPENISSIKIRPKCYDWCDQACGVMLTEQCKRKITSHRAQGRVYEYNPIFEHRRNREPVADEKITKLSLCCSTFPKEPATSVETSPAKQISIELKQLTAATTNGKDLTKEPNGNGDFSEDSLNSSERKAKESFFDTLNIPFIDESGTASSQSSDTKATKATKSNVQPTAVPDSSVPDQQLKEKHVSWSGCLSTCACIPKKLDDSDSSVYFTNAESDVEDKFKIDPSSGISSIEKLPVQNERKSEPSQASNIIKEPLQRNGKSAGDITEDRSLISNDETALLPYEENSLISNDGELMRNYTGNKVPLKFSIEYKYTDDEDGIEFVEARLPLCISSSNSNSSTPLKERNGQNEQKGRNDRRFEDLETSDSTAYDTDYIRTELKKLGFVSGPIAGATKKLYLKKLRRIRKTPEFEETIMKPIFSSELEHVLREDNDDWEKIITKWSTLETDILNHFSDNSLSSSWRSGTAKTSFTYLLLDPRVSDNLPARCERMDLSDVWRDFIHAVFYIGKGTRARPYEHLHEAFLVWKETKACPRKRCNLKVRHILEIWKEGLGVVCVQAFHNVIPAEAYTREAAMIDAIGLSRLKNEKAGIYYGVAASWNAKLKRRLGTYLLYRAMRIFIADNEVQLKPTDVR